MVDNLVCETLRVIVLILEMRKKAKEYRHVFGGMSMVFVKDIC